MTVELDPDAERALRKLLDRGALARLMKHLQRLARDLDADPFRGDLIQRRRVPKRLRGLPNLWRAELPHAWRALYTVAGYPGRGIVVRIVWVGDHKAFDRLFGYR